MPAITRLGDNCTGHGCHPPRPSSSASPDVYVNSIKVHRQSDSWSTHCCGSDCHDSNLASGSPTVYANNLAIGRIGDPVACGSAVAVGSGNVFADENGHSPIVAPESSPTVVQITTLPPESSESYYTPNIQVVQSYEVPESYPANAEQIEVEQAVTKGTDDCELITHKNPFEEAESLMNSANWKENGSNPNIVAMWDEIGYNGNHFADHTAWCAVFVSAVLKRSGNKYIKTASSQAYKNYGIEVPHINEAVVGDIVVFYRKGSNSGYGHVGIYAGAYTSTHIAVLGGNQSNNLNIRYFRRINTAKGWGIRSIRRAVSCKDGITTPPDYEYTIPSNIYNGGAVT